MSTIIKKGEKFYRQTIQEDEVHLEDLEDLLESTKRRKTISVAKETKDFDDQITEIQDEINQIKTL